MSSLACWNVRGFNQPFKRKEVRDLIRENNVGICGMLETHVAKRNVDSVFNKMFRNWSWISNSEMCNKGCRIVLGWDVNLFEVMMMFTTDQVIHCLVTTKTSRTHFFCSFVYAENGHVPRRQLWHSLQVFSILVGEAPWLVLGDFNATLKVDEIAGGVIGNSYAMEEFRECVFKIEVMDLHFTGMRFTWSGSPQGIGVVKKLDRALVNVAFQSKFQLAKARFLAPKTSDHSPIIVDFNLEIGILRLSFKISSQIGVISFS